MRTAHPTGLYRLYCVPLSRRGGSGVGEGRGGTGEGSRVRARKIAAADRSTSASVVDQFDTEIRIAAMPCQVVPLSQQVPSAWTRVTTSRVYASESPPPGGVKRTSTWFRTTSLRTSTPG